jgi:hypothetical protein
MSSKLAKFAGAAVTLTAMSSQVFGLEECRGPETTPSMSAKELAVTLAKTDPENWPAIAHYPDSFLSDVRVQLRSAVDIQGESDAAKKLIKEEILDKLKAGQAVDFEAVKVGINPNAHDIIDALDAKDLIKVADIEDAMKAVGTKIYNVRHAAANDILKVMEELPFCPPPAAGPANVPS